MVTRLSDWFPLSELGVPPDFGLVNVRAGTCVHPAGLLGVKEVIWIGLILYQTVTDCAGAELFLHCSRVYVTEIFVMVSPDVL